jgi:hypothetical protein
MDGMKTELVYLKSLFKVVKFFLSAKKCAPPSGEAHLNSAAA